VKRLILHGHFYQPPRENPWTGMVGQEPGALPFLNWNERIDYECYRANAFGRLMDDDDRIERIINNFALLSFDVGPTLVQWLEKNDTSTLSRIVAADRASALQLGHGNAIAQSYNHTILPLDSERDRKTQIRWGLAAFRHSFDRDAEAMWLPETAANHAVLDDLIDHGMKFVILAPHQAKRVRPLTDSRRAGAGWRRVDAPSLDTSETYAAMHRDGSGRSLAVFFYDGALSRAIGFGDALSDSNHFGHAVADAAQHAALVHAAVDGETFGHHHAWGDRVVAHGLAVRAKTAGLQLTNYRAQLEEHPPTQEVELELGAGERGSSWSCAHGVERWRSNCGCRLEIQRESSQAWRGPLRAALELLREDGATFFERKGLNFFVDPWGARDAYVELILQPSRRRPWLTQHGRPGLARAEAEQAIQLMEFQRQLLLMFTSCGWFFDDIAGIESRQVLRHAARAVELWQQLGGGPPLGAFLDILRDAVSNDPREGNGAAIYAEILRTDRQHTQPEAESNLSALDREIVRLALERCLVASLEEASWTAADDLLALARRLDVAGQLFRAQEAYLAHAPAAEDGLVYELGLGLGFSSQFLGSREVRP
jgi:alpha-amylase/alpha-mannosidase (GH57 family)